VQAVGAIPISSGANRINLSTLWINAEQEDGNEDWRSTLEQRTAGSFDPAQQVILAFRSQSGSNPTYSPDDLESLRQTTIALLRDTADYGLRYAPDGSRRFATSRTGCSALIRTNYYRLGSATAHF